MYDKPKLKTNSKVEISPSLKLPILYRYSGVRNYQVRIFFVPQSAALLSPIVNFPNLIERYESLNFFGITKPLGFSSYTCTCLRIKEEGRLKKFMKFAEMFISFPRCCIENNFVIKLLTIM